MKYFLTIYFTLSLLSCSQEHSQKSESKNSSIEVKTNKDSLVINEVIKPNGLDLFIDSMKTENYLLDTNRIYQTIWTEVAKQPKSVDNGHQIILLPFPVESYSKHFTNPKTYFFAHWNETEKSFKNGNDYLLMTWTIDSIGIKNEKEIYNSLHVFMGNFPCYIFRHDSVVYAMSNRFTTGATHTRELTERMRDYIDKNAVIYRPFGGAEPR